MWVTADDVIAAWIGNDAPSDSDQVQLWIEKAERLVIQTVPGVVEWVGGDPMRREIAGDVVTAMVIRKFRNPEGYRTFNANQTSGPFSGNQSVTVGGDHPGELYLTDVERASLGASTRRRKAFSVMPRYR